MGCSLEIVSCKGPTLETQVKRRGRRRKIHKVASEAKQNDDVRRLKTHCSITAATCPLPDPIILHDPRGNFIAKRCSSTDRHVPPLPRPPRIYPPLESPAIDLGVAPLLPAFFFFFFHPRQKFIPFSRLLSGFASLFMGADKSQKICLLRRCYSFYIPRPENGNYLPAFPVKAPGNTLENGTLCYLFFRGGGTTPFSDTNSRSSKESLCDSSFFFFFFLSVRWFSSCFLTYGLRFNPARFSGFAVLDREEWKRALQSARPVSKVLSGMESPFQKAGWPLQIPFL
ncbi:hypothetical protein CDAR_40561 [Caerostris darwini]|uniref:Uncharacterized protein n=1 Tax=Caerostris darwini TaxID=1538125 RepID=A0AAV4RCA0_9ARAC|nr:hypothetical protein CDAR_40561 [Caerostris darwini]